MISLDDVLTFELRTKDKFTALTWQMSLWCNYKCPYCIQKNSRNRVDNKFPNIEELINEGKKLNEAIEKSNKDCIKLNLIGGEVTYFDLKRIFEEALTSSKIKRVTITSNLSQSYEFWDDLFSYMRSRDTEIRVSASLHESQIKDIDEFIRKAKNFASKVSFVITAENFKRILPIMERMKVENIKYYAELDRTAEQEILANKEINEFISQQKDKSYNHYRKILLKNGEIIKLSRSELLCNIDDSNMIFKDKFKCTSELRFKDGKFYKGACSDKKVLASEEDIINLESIDICTSYKTCSMCGAIRIDRIKDN